MGRHALVMLCIQDESTVAVVELLQDTLQLN